MRRWRVRPVAEWCDAWVGVYVDRRGRAVYILPVPFLGVRISW